MHVVLIYFLALLVSWTGTLQHGQSQCELDDRNLSCVQMAVGYGYYTRVHSQPFIYKSSSFGRSNGIYPLSSFNVELVVCKNIVRFEENLNA